MFKHRDVPAISVIVPVYNGEKYLGQCLNGILKQTFRDIELIALDDGSTDSTPEILADFAARDSRVRVVTKENSGYGATINRGIDEAHGEFVGIIEADDWPSPHMYARLHRAAVRNTCDLVKCDFYTTYETWEASANNFAGYPVGRVFDTVDEPQVLCIAPSPWAALYRRSWMLENNIRCRETPGAAFQDTSFTLKALFAARRCLLIGDNLVHYRCDNEASSTNSRDKALAVCGEYAEALAALRRMPDRCEQLAGWLYVIEWRSYGWNYTRIAPELRLPFAERVREEFLAAAADSAWNCDLFAVDELERVAELLELGAEQFVERYPETYQKVGG
ncbi:MAG: glycosyltransferase [Eggerthellaceae bacterium]|nr:glycosyltransferase [Eggerthellaceae bacterium]